MTAALAGLGEKTLMQMAQGNLSRLLIEGEHGALIVYPININAAIAAIVDKNAKMGLILHEIARTSNVINSILNSSL